MPTREIAIDLARKLITGEADPIEVARWAQRFHWVDRDRGSVPSIEDIEQKDPLLGEFIGDLTLADALDDKHDFLYTKEDFQVWLNEFLEKIGKQN